jgi:hypothetical protein
MFEKQRVAFSNKDVFGPKFTPDVKSCFCKVSQMLFADKINTDGTLDINKAGLLTKEELWSYVYYLFYYNHSNVPVFKSMSNVESGKAKASLFYGAVASIVYGVDEDSQERSKGNASPKKRGVKPFDTTTLIIFVNNILEEFGKQIINPVFDYLQVILRKNIVSRIADITIKTGNNSGFKIVTDAKDVANANVKFNFSMDEADVTKTRI